MEGFVSFETRGDVLLLRDDARGGWHGGTAPNAAECRIEEDAVAHPVW